MDAASVTVICRATLDAARFSPDTMAALVAAIDVNDRIDMDAALPASVRLDYPADSLVEGFALSRQLWHEGYDRAALIAMASDLRRGGRLDEDGRRWFKQVRARFKHLRFAFYLYSAEHNAPRMLSLVTLEMGELQDSVRVRGPREVRRHAAALQLLLSGPGQLLLARTTDRLRLSDAAGFRDFTLAQMNTLQPLLLGRPTGAHAFHAARKVVSRQVSFHDDMRTLAPSDEHRTMARWLATLNGLMGAFHDDLVTRGAAGRFDYARDTFELPEAIRDRLGALVELYLGTSSSEPPAA